MQSTIKAVAIQMDAVLAPRTERLKRAEHLLEQAVKPIESDFVQGCKIVDNEGNVQTELK